MTNTEIYKILEDKLPKENIKIDEPMKQHTTFKVGGNADIFITIKTIEELKTVMETANEYGITLTVLGNGSNVIVTDKGIRGITIKINLDKMHIYKKDNSDNIEIEVDAGVPLGFIARKLLKEEISGFEELSGIPGTIGGAIVMNAGAHGKEIKDIVIEIMVIDYKGNIQKLSNTQAQFAYRKSIFMNKKYIILKAKMNLTKGKQEQIEEKMEQYAQYRKEKQPIEYPSAGSTFKRKEGIITAKLIDEAGLKGYKIGGAEVSTKHAGFIINTGNAKATDIIKLVKHIQDEIYQKFNVKIELETEIFGEK